MAITYTALRIVKGTYVLPAPAASLPSDNPQEVINLLAGGNGFGVTSDGWIPKFSQVQGVSQSTGTGNGSTLVNYTMQNVTESISLLSAASNPVSRFALVSQLVRFGRMAREFHVSKLQPDPVFLEWHAAGAVYPQYALIQNIDIAQDTDAFISDNTATLSITIEREPYWRTTPPGAIPTWWISQQLNDYTVYTSLERGYGQADTVYGFNRSSGWTSNYSEKNTIDIASTALPGDTRLKASIALFLTNWSAPSYNDSALIGVYPRPTSWTISGTTYYTTLSFNGGSDALTLGADTSYVADTGAPVVADGTQKRGSISFATTAGNASRLVWRTKGEVFKGTFAVFARARVSAAGTTAKISVGLSSIYADDVMYAQTPTQTITDAGTGGTSNTGEWALVYLGVISCPAGDTLQWSAYAASAQLDPVYVRFFAQRTAGAGALYLADITFMPIDYASFTLEGINGTTFVGGGRYLYDCTGYMLHGREGSVAGYIYNTYTPDVKRVMATGSTFELEPNTTNRVIMLPYIASTKRSIITATGTYTMAVNVSPRWLGARSV